MKKIASFMLAFMLGIVAIASLLSCGEKNVAQASNLYFIENVLSNKQDIVAPSTGSLGSASASLHNAPFDTDSNLMMSGYTYTPRVDKYGQQEITFQVTKFVADNNKSVFLWIYFPEVLPNDLTITIYGENGVVGYWKFTSANLLNILDNYGKKAVAYGWKLFELQFDNIYLENDLETCEGIEFSSMKISYKMEVLIEDEVSTEGISFYHIFMADCYSVATGICYYQNFTNFDVKNNFANNLENIYVGDDLKINGIYDIFEYVIVGKYDLKNYSNLEDFNWSIVIKDVKGNDVAIKFGEVYTFEKSGWYSVNIKLSKITGGDEENVLNVPYSLYCDNFNIGSFSNKNYFFDENTTHVISFVMVDNFVPAGDVLISVSDKNVAEVTNYTVSDGVCHVTVFAKSSGNIKLTLSAYGARDGYENAEYSCQTTIYVNEVDSGFSKTLVWIVFAGFCAFLGTFLIISLVKARRFSVK